MATYSKLKVFENGGMIQFATEADELITSEPKGSVRILKTGNGFSFEHVSTGSGIASVTNFADILDSSGAVYGASFADVLTALSFFFEVGAGSTGVDVPYAAAQWHSFTENYDAPTSRSLDANFFVGFQVLIKKEVTLSSIAARYTAGVAGACVVGIYTTGTNGHPDVKLLQSAIAFNNASTGVQQVAISGGNTVVPAGLYWVMYLSSSTPTIAALNQNTIVNASGWNSAMTAPNSVWFRALAYTATLPSTAGSGAFGSYGGTVPFFTFLTA